MTAARLVAPAAGPGGRSGRFLAVSLLGHGAVALALALASAAPQRRPPAPEPSVEVEIVALPAGPGAAPVPAQPAVPAHGAEAARAEPDRLPDRAAAEPGRPAEIRAARILSEAALADPKSRAARQALAGMAGEDRIAQLCGIEAIEQVRAWDRRYRPDQVVAYALAEPTLDRDTLVADGAAFHSGRQWIGLSFRCELTPDHRRVAGFAFTVGAPVPRRDWERHNLPAEVDPAG